MKYDVVVGDSLIDVVNLVNVKLSEGWSPAGGLSVNLLSDGLAVFAQSIVLYENPMEKALLMKRDCNFG